MTTRATSAGRIGRAGALAAAAWVALAAPTRADPPELVSHTLLRICADPANLPFSNQMREGFENKIAQIIGADLGLPVTYVWYPQSVGFVRSTLRKNECDLVMGTVSGDSEMENTNPYYHSGYMLVTRADSALTARALDDPAFADKRIGLIAATPPSDILVKLGLMAHVTSYSLMIDTRYELPAREIAQDVIDGKLDVGILWGPYAGYFIKREHLPLRAVFLDAKGGGRLDFHIAMGVRPGEPEWRRRIDQAIQHHQDEITKILEDYGVPLLDEQNRPIPEPGASP